MSLENVRAFYEKLVNDQAFRTQMQQVESKDESTRLVKEAGYDFTPEEFEEYTAQLLESNADDGEIRHLNDQELEAVFGGAASLIDNEPIVRPLYGVVEQPHEKPCKKPRQKWPPIHPQPVYGIPTNEQAI
ncbi:MAG: Nif11-like leader peptide family natural product precursor [Nostoc sp. ChiQUE02]|uniref:Nif11-like leader peptide family natural product precursor n=1 Tax=Nostoc sp. ChiQUE02 TaxID=3075377 RepID=UPI002AD5511B|nr:Nif11-like leader peptide family natural product precursor [Nostoc sp. ChiQUE02]MDZ8229612.1 Nif11-like leader peptide family natural product precursor [Nostoc sp. ChiQUE02]